MNKKSFFLIVLIVGLIFSKASHSKDLEKNRLYLQGGISAIMPNNTIVKKLDEKIEKNMISQLQIANSEGADGSGVTLSSTRYTVLNHKTSNKEKILKEMAATFRERLGGSKSVDIQSRYVLSNGNEWFEQEFRERNFILGTRILVKDGWVYTAIIGAASSKYTTMKENFFSQIKIQED